MPITVSLLLFVVAVLLWIVTLVRRARSTPAIALFDNTDVLVLLVIAFYVGTLRW